VATAATANKRMAAAAGRMRSEAMAAGLMFPLPWDAGKRGVRAFIWWERGEEGSGTSLVFAMGLWCPYITSEPERFVWLPVEVGNLWSSCSDPGRVLRSWEAKHGENCGDFG
jgi:hypothetical protein